MFYHFIINSRAKKAKLARQIIEKTMSDRQISYQLMWSEGEGFLKRAREIFLNQNISEQDTRIIIVGGDGSFRPFITLLEDLEMDIPLGYIAAGTGNDFARSVGLSLDIQEAVDDLLSLEKSRVVDILKKESAGQVEYGVNSIGFGLDGATIYDIEVRNKRFKKILGSLSFLPGALNAYRKFRGFNLEVVTSDGCFHFQDVKLALVTNNKFFGGGINIYPSARNDDRTFELAVGYDVTGLQFIDIVHRLLRGARHLEHKQMHPY